MQFWPGPKHPYRLAFQPGDVRGGSGSLHHGLRTLREHRTFRHVYVHIKPHGCFGHCGCFGRSHANAVCPEHPRPLGSRRIRCHDRVHAGPQQHVKVQLLMGRGYSDRVTRTVYNEYTLAENRWRGQRINCPGPGSGLWFSTATEITC